eukprot:scaffold1435_cov267-Pinguiococcus_pyrenoidosus.AAC.32
MRALRSRQRAADLDRLHDRLLLQVGLRRHQARLVAEATDGSAAEGQDGAVLLKEVLHRRDERTAVDGECSRRATRHAQPRQTGAGPAHPASNEA